MRVSSDQMQRSALNSILDQQAKLSKIQTQVATGQRVVTPADDPISATAILDLKHALAVSDQQQRGLDSAKGRLQIEDTVLTSANDGLQRLRSIVIQAGNTSLNNDDRRYLSSEVDQILENLLGVANTTDSSGDYLFAGFMSDTLPFTKNSAGGFDYNGDDGQRFAQIGPSITLPDGDSGTAVFRAIKNGNGTFATAEGGNTGGGANQGSAVIDPGLVSGTYVPDTYTITFTVVPASSPPSYTYTVTDSAAAVVAGPTAYVEGGSIDLSVVGIKTTIRGTPADGDTFTLSPSVNQDIFQTVRNVYDTLQSGFTDDASQAAYENALNRAFIDLDQGIRNILDIQVQVGARLNTIDQQFQNNDSYAAQLKETLSRVEDLDFPTAVSQMNLLLTSLQAAQQSFVRIQDLSLFNYLR